MVFVQRETRLLGCFYGSFRPRLDFLRYVDLMAEVGVVPRRLLAVGDGRRSELWAQIVSDVTGQSLEWVEQSIGPALATAFLAGSCLGLFDNFAPPAERWVRIGRAVRPAWRVSAVYDQYYRVYRRPYERTAAEMHELARLSTVQPTPTATIESAWSGR